MVVGEELIEILENGYQIFYSEVDEFINEDMPGEEGEFVLDLLSIYRAVKDYKRNNPNDTDINDHLFSTFRGFDGNNESKYMDFTKFLIKRQHKFEEQKKYERETDSFNSHHPTLDKYRRMVDKWHALGRPNHISKNGILEILNLWFAHF